MAVEPLPDVHAQLAANYADSPRVRTVRTAVSTSEGETVRLSSPKVGPTGWSSLTPQRSMIGRMGIGEKDVLQTEVRAMTLATLWRQHVVGYTDRVDILVLDMEGHDADVILSTNFTQLHPSPRYEYILYEQVHIPQARKQAVLEHLEAAGYALLRRVFAPENCGSIHQDNLMEWRQSSS